MMKSNAALHDVHTHGSVPTLNIEHRTLSIEYRLLSKVRFLQKNVGGE